MAVKRRFQFCADTLREIPELSFQVFCLDWKQEEFDQNLTRYFIKMLINVNYSFQLRAALYDIYDIFFTMEVSERMNILRHDREVRKEKMLRQMVCYIQENVNC